MYGWKIDMKKQNRRKKVALVLSSGGARGLVHIGVIEELLAEGYEISSIAGCSMGALVGGIYATGRLPEFREWMKTINKRKMLELADLSLSINHVVKGERIIEAIKEIVPDVRIENLPVPFCAVATDWLHGREVVFRKGSLFDAIRASISLPSFFSPVRRDGMILIDGGIVNPIPLNRVARTEGDILMGVDVSGHDYEGQTELQKVLDAKQKRDKSIAKSLLARLIPDDIEFNYITLLSRTSSLMIRQNSKLMVELFRPDLLLDIQLGRFGSFDYDKSEKLVAIGRQRTRRLLQRIATT